MVTKHCNATVDHRTERVVQVDECNIGNDVDVDLLAHVCRYVRNRLEDPISLDDLARACGRTTRCIQYAFRQRLGCSPTEWIRRERLLLAHRRLSCGTENTTVCDVAFASGFNHLSMFAHYYRERFNEAPSATLARAVGKVRGSRPVVRCPSRSVDIGPSAESGCVAPVSDVPPGVLH